MKIYTKRGDQGQTDLLNGQRIAKNDLVLECGGMADECSVIFGLAKISCQDPTIKQRLEQVQQDLIFLGTELSDTQQNLVSTDWIKRLEEEIDYWTADLPPLTQWIISGVNLGSTLLHLTRVKVRELERRVVTLNQNKPVHSNLLAYLNRLSDWCFTLARYLEQN